MTATKIFLAFITGACATNLAVDFTDLEGHFGVWGRVADSSGIEQLSGVPYLYLFLLPFCLGAAVGWDAGSRSLLEKTEPSHIWAGAIIFLSVLFGMVLD